MRLFFLLFLISALLNSMHPKTGLTIRKNPNAPQRYRYANGEYIVHIPPSMIPYWYGNPIYTGRDSNPGT